ncbi:hypothetical protein CF165_44540 [Amycolatopsis vastitatis]|uniref:Uncharacterized protein n=1 Tax=Amycolatopsis vastitatis TaxID=1905142 RepID=A0A229SM88_9PSEU|nr:hypothetical protein CF165_44540 [Amycolatopsis vastitatis]
MTNGCSITVAKMSPVAVFIVVIAPMRSLITRTADSSIHPDRNGPSIGAPAAFTRSCRHRRLPERLGGQPCRVNAPARSMICPPTISVVLPDTLRIAQGA